MPEKGLEAKPTEKGPKFTIKDINGNWNDKEKTFNYKPNPYEMRKNPKMDANCTISVYGKRKTGKSIWTKWYMHNHKDVYPWGWVFTKTRNNKFWENMVPKDKILGEYTPYNLQKITERQKEMMSMYIKGMDVNPLAFVIWDDALGNEIKYDDYLSTYYFNSRHFGTLNIMTAQHVTGTPPCIRQNTDMGVIFKNYNKQALDHLTDDFSHTKDKDEFARTIHKYTEDQSFLAIDNDPNTHDEDYMYYGKADKIDEPFALGCEIYWRQNPTQYQELMEGKYLKQMDRISELSDVDKVVKLFDVSRPGRQIDSAAHGGNQSVKRSALGL